MIDWLAVKKAAEVSEADTTPTYTGPIIQPPGQPYENSRAGDRQRAVDDAGMEFYSDLKNYGNAIAAAPISMARTIAKVPSTYWRMGSVPVSAFGQGINWLQAKRGATTPAMAKFNHDSYGMLNAPADWWDKQVDKYMSYPKALQNDEGFMDVMNPVESIGATFVPARWGQFLKRVTKPFSSSVKGQAKTAQAKRVDRARWNKAMRENPSMTHEEFKDAYGIPKDTTIIWDGSRYEPQEYLGNGRYSPRVYREPPYNAEYNLATNTISNSRSGDYTKWDYEHIIPNDWVLHEGGHAKAITSGVDKYPATTAGRLTKAIGQRLNPIRNIRSLINPWTDPTVHSEVLADNAAGWTTPYSVVKHHPHINSYYNGARDAAARTLGLEGIGGWMGYNWWKNRKQK